MLTCAITPLYIVISAFVMFSGRVNEENRACFYCNYIGYISLLVYIMYRYTGTSIHYKSEPYHYRYLLK